MNHYRRRGFRVLALLAGLILALSVILRFPTAWFAPSSGDLARAAIQPSNSAPANIADIQPPPRFPTRLAPSTSTNATTPNRNSNPERTLSQLSSAAGTDQHRTNTTQFLAQFGYAGQWDQTVEPTLVAFREWTLRYASAVNDSDKAKLVESGIALATARRSVIAGLIETDPALALALTIPAPILQALPRQVRDLVEQRIEGVGRFSVKATTPAAESSSPSAGSSPALRRSVTLGGVSYGAHVYGRRLYQRTREDIWLHGIALGRQMAVHESPLRLLDLGEASGGTPGDCPVCVQLPSTHAAGTIPSNPVAVQSHAEAISKHKSEYGFELIAKAENRITRLCTAMHGHDLESALIELERLPGPRKAHSNLDFTRPGLAASPLPVQASPPMSWTTGLKKVLVVRVDFSDVPGVPLLFQGSVPLTEQAATNLIQIACNDFYAENSYSQTTLSAAVTPVLRMPQSAEAYAVNDRVDELNSDARAAAVGAGFVLGDYDRVMIAYSRLYTNRFANSQWGWAGLGEIEGSTTWMNGYFDHRVTNHELGHNFGLYHANFWSTTDGTPHGAGSSSAYDDPFDTMGRSGGDNRYHFNQWFKHRLGWLPANSVSVGISNHVYRITRFDHQDATGIRALRIPQSAGRSYWIGVRRAFTNEPTLANGIYCLYGYDFADVSNLLDMTPGSKSGTDDAADAGLELGRTFSDASAGIYLTPIAQGGSGTVEYVDIALNLGVAPGNRPPVASFGSQPNGRAGEPFEISIQATDPDGDSLAFAWNLGAGIPNTNSATRTALWHSGGVYTVTCTVSDMKGQITTASVDVTILDPLQNWRVINTGSSARLNAFSTHGTRWIAVGTSAILHSPDGVAWESINAGVNVHLKDIVHAAGLSVAVGEDHDGLRWVSHIKASLDGEIWQTCDSGGNGALHGVAWAGGRWVAVGEAGTILTSDNGFDWTSRSSGESNRLSGVSHGDSGWVAVGNAGAVVMSADGLTWTRTSIPLAGDLSAVAFGDGQYVAVGFGNHFASANGADWIRAFPGMPFYDLRDIAYADGQFLAAGRLSFGGVTWSNIVIGSRSGGPWSARGLAFGPAPNAIDYQAAAFVITGETGLLAISDRFPPPTNSRPIISALSDISLDLGLVLSPVEFQVSDAEQSAADLTVSAHSSDTVWLPDSSLVLGGSGTNRTLTMTSPQIYGGARISIEVSDGFLSATNSFQLTLQPPPPPALESDVAPRGPSYGSGNLTVADWVQLGRFAAGLDTPSSGSEFQRADCAPISSFGDGQITVADWVQAGRYAAGLDGINPAAGPLNGG